MQEFCLSCVSIGALFRVVAFGIDPHGYAGIINDTADFVLLK